MLILTLEQVVDISLYYLRSNHIKLTAITIRTDVEMIFHMKKKTLLSFCVADVVFFFSKRVWTLLRTGGTNKYPRSGSE